MEYILVHCVGLQPVLSTNRESHELDDDDNDNDNGKWFYNNKSYVKGAIFTILNIHYKIHCSLTSSWYDYCKEM